MTVYFSQGSVATDLKEGGSFNSIFLRRSFLNGTVKKLWKLFHVCRSYRKNKIIGTLFSGTRCTVWHACISALRAGCDRQKIGLIRFVGDLVKGDETRSVCPLFFGVYFVFIMASLIVFGYFPCSVSWLSLVVNFGANDWQKRSPKCADGDVKPYSFTQADQSMNSILNARTDDAVRKWHMPVLPPNVAKCS